MVVLRQYLVRGREVLVFQVVLAAAVVLKAAQLLVVLVFRVREITVELARILHAAAAAAVLVLLASTAQELQQERAALD